MEKHESLQSIHPDVNAFVKVLWQHRVAGMPALPGLNGLFFLGSALLATVDGPNQHGR